MFKKLKRQMILIEAASFLLVTIIIISVINIIAYRQMIQSAHQVLMILADSGGVFVDTDPSDSSGKTDESSTNNVFWDRNYNLGFGAQFTEETKYITRYFIVKLGEDDQIINYDLEHIAAVSDTDIESYIDRTLRREADEGMVSNYRYLKRTNDDGTLSIYYVDCYQQQTYVTYLMHISLLIGGVCMLFVLVFVYIFAGRAIKPMEENMERQKRFITDAGHELKTPLAALSANVDVLELISGENETTKKIKKQTKQMGLLVNEMLTLTRMDVQSIPKSAQEDIDLTQLVTMAVSDFAPIVQTEQKFFEVNIKQGIHMRGVRKDIERLISVLMDNAVKYCSENGTISVALRKSSRHVIFTVTNSGDSIPPEKLKHLFERFYRADDSRSRDTGSFGIGLSIAKAVVDKHKGKITAANVEKGVQFCLELPLR